MHSFPKGLKKDSSGDFPSGPVVKILPSDAGYTSWIPGQATKISHASGQLNLCSATTELTHCIAKVWMRQRRPNAAKINEQIKRREKERKRRKSIQEI